MADSGRQWIDGRVNEDARSGVGLARVHFTISVSLQRRETDEYDRNLFTELFLARLDFIMSSDTKSNRIVMLCMCGLGRCELKSWI